MYEVKRAFADIPDGQVHYRCAGEGEPVLLLHQTAMSSVEYAPVVMPMLAKHYSVVAMDTLGYGDSDKPPRTDYTVADFSRSVIRFLDALKIKRAHIAGHHTGATIALDIAVSYPERVNKLVLSACPCITPEEGQVWMNDPRRQGIEPGPDGSHLIEIWRKAMERFTPPTPAMLDHANEYTIDLLKAGVRRVEAYRAVFTYNSKAVMPLVKSRTLLMCGDKDVLFSHLAPASGLIPDNQVKTINGAPNQVIRLFPEEWGNNVLQFLLSR